MSPSSRPGVAKVIRAEAKHIVHNYIKVPHEEIAATIDRKERQGLLTLAEVQENVQVMGHEMKQDAEDVARLAVAEDMAKVQFLGQELKIDDEGATVVIVFPRADPFGPIKSNEMVKDPLKATLAIFERQFSHGYKENASEGFEALGSGGPITVGRYQRFVRSKFLHLLRKSGFRVTTFPSVDGDEVFAKISLDIKGDVIKHLAQRFSYAMPFNETAYQDVLPHGIYEGHKPMYRQGKPVTAFGPYNKEISHLMGEFRNVDEIRIIDMQLSSLVSLEQMKRQGVISKYFAVAPHDELQKLHREWLQHKYVRRCSGFLAVWAKAFEIPRVANKSGLLRNYFGEEIAFFFRWFAFYTKMLAVLGVLGALFHLIDGFDANVERVLHISFSFVMVIWATVFNQLFRNQMARAQQDWGMQDYELGMLSPDRADYNPDLEGSWHQVFKRGLSYYGCLMFCCMFIGVISLIEGKKKEQLEEDGMGDFFKNHGSIIVVSTIKVWSIAWGYIAPMLADMQNHRTKERWDDGLTFMLAGVKIFVTLWNFFYVAFVKNWTSPTCDESLQQVATRIWATSNFSELLAANNTIVAPALEELSKPHFSYTTTRHVCARGCFPATPDMSRPGAETNCYHILRYELVTFFFVHVIYTVVFLLWPVIKVKYDMLMELRESQQMQEEGEIDDDYRKRSRQYSWLQFQAKCPPYEYQSWGGSRVEHFLECAIGYALITCFGIMYPMLCLFAFLGNMIEYRLLAYGMTHVTCRPIPRGASGIGFWQVVFESISNTAVIANVLLIVFVMSPMRSQPIHTKLIFFIVLEHALLGIRGAIDNVIPDSPQDVLRIEDFNTHFKSTMVKYPPLLIPEKEQYKQEYANVDFGLWPGESLDASADNNQNDSGETSLPTSSEDDAPDRSPWCSCEKQPPVFHPL